MRDDLRIKCGAAVACCALGLGLTLLSGPVFAEAPLNTEGAETEQSGSYEVEAEISFDDDSRGLAAGIGYVPFRNIEVEAEAFLGRDRGENPAADIREGELSLKWVPEQSGLGISYGLALSVERELEDNNQGEREFETAQGITGLFSYDIDGGPLVHFNLGLISERREGESETSMVYGLGFETRIARRLTLTAEVFGEENKKADKQIGLRYKLSGDSSLYVRVGRGNDRTFGGVGIAFEFEPD